MTMTDSYQWSEGLPRRLEIRPRESFIEWSAEEIEGSVPARFEKVVGRYGERLALKGGSLTLSYDELNRKANQLAHAILSLDGEGEKPISLMMEHGPGAVMAILAILKAGKFYVPLDPAYPASQLEGILADSCSNLLITDQQNLPRAEEVISDTIKLLNIHNLDDGFGQDNIDISTPPERLFNLTYTSGSTGQPKGVLQTHRNVLHNTLEATHLLKFTREDCFALVMPITFGASMSDIFGALLNGASLLPFDLKKQGLGAFIQWLKQEKISIIHTVPTVYRHMLGMLKETEILPDLRLIELGGEPVIKHDIKLFKQHFSDKCTLMNDLGTTETYLATWYFVDKTSQIMGSIVPVGFPLNGRAVLVLDQNRKAVNIGEIGEIAIKSRYLSPGYWKRPDLTADTFIPDPEGGHECTYLTGDLGRLMPNGCLEHLGRKDDLVKIRGQRVEIAEVESVLLDMDAVREAVVIARKAAYGNSHLVAYLVPAQHPPNVSDLRKALAEKFPDHMIPTAFVMMDRFPLLPFGKVNRRALPPPDSSRPVLDVPFQPPKNLTQAKLADLYAKVLKLDQVGINDNFFELGGNSLLATQLAMRIEDEFQIELSVVTLFETPTVVGMEKFVIQRQLEQLSGSDLDQILAEMLELTDEEAQCILDRETELKHENIKR